MRKLDVVNFLRGYSISTIVIMHLVGMLGISGIWEKAAAFGGAGVHVFILCSGFGLYLSYLRKPLGYIAFLKKRFRGFICRWPSCAWPRLSGWLVWGVNGSCRCGAICCSSKCSFPNWRVLWEGRCGLCLLSFSSILLGLLLLSYLTFGGGKACAHCQPVMVYDRRPVRVCRGASLEQFLPAIFMGVLLRDEDGRNISWQS